MTRLPVYLDADVDEISTPGATLSARRRAVYRAITPDAIYRAMQSLLALALDGNVKATALILQYTVGMPKDSSEVDAQTAQTVLDMPASELVALLVRDPKSRALIQSALATHTLEVPSANDATCDLQGLRDGVVDPAPTGGDAPSNGVP